MKMMSMEQIKRMNKILGAISIVMGILWMVYCLKVNDEKNIILALMNGNFLCAAVYFIITSIMSLICGEAKIEWLIRSKGVKTKGVVIRKEKAYITEEDHEIFYRILFNINYKDKVIKSRSLELVDAKSVPKSDAIVYFYEEYPKYLVLDKQKYYNLIKAIIFGLCGIGMIGGMIIF